MIKIYKKLLNHFGKQFWWPCKSGRRFEIIVGAILTQNTNWKNVEKALDNLEKKRLMNKKAISKISLNSLATTIKPSGYYKQKAKKLKAFVSFSGEITRDNLLSIWGIGPETADSILLYAYNKPYFVIDAYTRRVFTRLGLLKGNENYEEIRNYFEKNIPRSISVYKEFHALIVELAKNYCKNKPLCKKCPLADSCKFTNKNQGSVWLQL